MAGNETHNGALLLAQPDAASAECDGNGWGILTHADGFTESARCPECERESLIRSVQAFVPPRFQASIELPEAAKRWAQRAADAQGLYLAGQVGTGKTHTAWHAAIAWCVATGTVPSDGKNSPYEGRFTPTVIFTRMTDLLDDLRPGDDSRQRVRDCQNCKLLILDDIGAEKASEWTQERLYSVIDHRYANCLPLIVTSNLPPGELPGKPGTAGRNPLSGQIGARAESRLAEMCEVVAMTGTDRRKS